jgi:hypothetical protein
MTVLIAMETRFLRSQITAQVLLTLGRKTVTETE